MLVRVIRRLRMRCRVVELDANCASLCLSGIGVALALAMRVESRLKLSASTYGERRLLREYLDLPGLSLTLAQAARLACVDAPSCQVVLDHLVSAHCLAHTESG